MDFFTRYFSRVDSLVATFGSDVMGRAAEVTTPYIAAGLVLSYIFFGLAIVRGAIQTPLMDFANRAFFIAVVAGISVAGGLYQTEIAGFVRSAPDALASTLAGNQSGGQGASHILDNAAKQGWDLANKAWERMSFSPSGILYMMMGFNVLMLTGALCGIGTAVLTIAKVYLGIMVALGPIFIPMLLFKPTKGFFDKWAGLIITYALMIVLYGVASTFGLTLFAAYTSSVEFDGVQNAAYNMGAIVSLFLALAGLFWQIPAMSQSLGSGIAAQLPRGGMPRQPAKGSSPLDKSPGADAVKNGRTAGSPNGQQGGGSARVGGSGLRAGGLATRASSRRASRQAGGNRRVA